MARLWSISSTVLLGKDADRTGVIAQLSPESKQPFRLGLVYFATHGITDTVNPMDGSFLALKGDYLYGRDIKKLNLLTNPLVVMSACQSGLGKTFDAGTFGLARAWWEAGAARVVMSLWNIDDAATRDLMVKFIDEVSLRENSPVSRGLGKNDIRLSREEALRGAMLDMRAKYEDPALWTSFLLFGIPTRIDPEQHRGGRIDPRGLGGRFLDGDHLVSNVDSKN